MRCVSNEVIPLDDLESNVESIAAEIAVTHPLFFQAQKLALHRRFELMGIREQIYSTKDFDAMLHWSKLGAGNFDILREEYDGDRRKMTEAQNQPGYWEKLEK